MELVSRYTQLITACKLFLSETENLVRVAMTLILGTRHSKGKNTSDSSIAQSLDRSVRMLGRVLYVSPVENSSHSRDKRTKR